MYNFAEDLALLYEMQKDERKNEIGMTKYQLFLCISRPFKSFEYQQNVGLKYEKKFWSEDAF